MENSVIKIQDLGKKYRIRHDGRRSYQTLREALPRALHSFLHPFKTAREAAEDFWALKEVSFDVKRGECVGIIGRNGAGKSTLLKILSRIMEPTTGQIELRGRVGSLLEVGTGFHAELTGRENIYLNGTILGMKKKEIDRKFDEIVAFAQIEKFLDTPVKRYSSGMYVRLAFAVAAHLEPEILIVDEVLAVGDVSFQKKCLGKMGDVAKEGRTVLFVSHNMAAISALCKKTVVLRDGKISFEGDVERGIRFYLDEECPVKGFADLHNKKSNLWGQPKIFSRILSIETLNEKEERQSFFKMGECLRIKIKLEIMDDRKGVEVGIFIWDHDENRLGLLSSAAEGFNNIHQGMNELQIEIPQITLMPGEYTLGIWVVHQRQVDDACEKAISIDVLARKFTGSDIDFDRFKGYGSMVRSHWKAMV